MEGAHLVLWIPVPRRDRVCHLLSQNKLRPNKAVHLTPTRVTPDACRFAAASVAPRAGVGDLGRSAPAAPGYEPEGGRYPDGLDCRVIARRRPRSPRRAGRCGVAGAAVRFMPWCRLPLGYRYRDRMRKESQWPLATGRCPRGRRSPRGRRKTEPDGMAAMPGRSGGRGCQVREPGEVRAAGGA